jgi:4-hydroxy-tetrahydrodipicolinate synthase
MSSSSTAFAGVLAAVVTPLSNDASTIDSLGVLRQVNHIVGAGVHGLVPGGSTGEFTTLTLTERKQATELYVEAADGRVPVVAGTGALSTAETIDLTRHAKDIGAAAVMIAPPFYTAPTWDELLAHYGAISDAVDIDIMYYNLPEATGVDLSAQQLAELARTSRVTSFKDTGGDAVKFAAVLNHHTQDITPLNGYDTLTFSAFAAGAKAAVWGAASVIPALCVELYDAIIIDGDLAKARELWAHIFPICEFLESHNYASAIKAGLDLVGVPAGPVRLPVLRLAQEHVDQFARLLTSAGVHVHQTV